MELEIKNAEKNFQGKTVLDGFSLKFPRTGTVCLFGPSGCGKTTLLNCIAGLLKLDSGEILGTKKQKISYVFQEDRLLPWITAGENVAAVLRGGAAQNAAAREWLEKVGLSGDADKRPGELSGGMRQRVSIARALAYGGDLYLLDEPFHALDEKSKSDMISLFRRETASALKILVTHDPKEAEVLADIIYVLSGPPVKIIKITKN
jgi:NitT/TauT family transport system ATP-binding protein